MAGGQRTKRLSKSCLLLIGKKEKKESQFLFLWIRLLIHKIEIVIFFFFCFELVIAGIERFAFKGVASNLVTYLTDVVKMSNSNSAKTVNNWIGFTSMLPLLVASVADSCWDKYPTILASSFIYVVVSFSSSCFFPLIILFLVHSSFSENFKPLPLGYLP